MDIKVITLREAQAEDTDFLWYLLTNRPKHHCISHKEMPCQEYHADFIKHHPYYKWWIIEVDGEDYGSVYLTKYLHEIGIHLIKENDGIKEAIVRGMKKRFSKARLLANVAIDNIEGQKFWESQGFKKLQVTYELDS